MDMVGPRPANRLVDWLGRERRIHLGYGDKGIPRRGYGPRLGIVLSMAGYRMRKRSVHSASMTDDKRETSNICRILLVEDDAPVRERLAGIIGQWAGGELVAACGTFAEAKEAIERKTIDLLITDLKLPDGHGVQVIQILRARQPDAEAMVISALADDRNVTDAIAAGATGYLLKDSDPINVIDAITQLLAGGSPISSTIARTIVRQLGGRDAAADHAKDDAAGPRLTPREMDILWGIAKGFTYSELAERLEISKQTVPVHIKNIYRKLQASNRSEAVYEASRRGLIRL
jgi:DNA-binding NarL/FixJ family response regulator